MNHIVLGRLGEETAATLLQQQGYRIWRRNYRCKAGEIDLIASKDETLSFIEVKTRRSFHYGRPCESITQEKKVRVRKAASCYLKELADQGYVPEKIKFDVVEIVIRHTEYAF